MPLFSKPGFKSLFIFLIIAILSSMLTPQSGAVQAASLQQGDFPACTGQYPVTLEPPACNDIQILFLVDDSASMGDPGRVSGIPGNDLRVKRFEAIETTVNTLGETYLTALQNRAINRPNFQVAVVHFATGIDLIADWQTIAPENRQAWDESGQAAINQVLFDNEKINNIDYDRNDPNRATDFRNPFREAVTLLDNLIVPEGDCTNPIVILLTDGEPDEGEGYLYLKDKRFGTNEVQRHFDEVKAHAEKIQYPIYILAFDNRDNTYWSRTETFWNTEIATEALLVSLDEESASSQVPGLISRIQATIENTLAGAVATVPPNLESVAFNYAAPSLTAVFDIYDPNGDLVNEDSSRVEFAVDGLQRTVTIQQPVFGEYRIELSQGGGTLDVALTYPDTGNNFSVNTLQPVFQQYTAGDLVFQLQDGAGASFPLPAGSIRYLFEVAVPGKDSDFFELTPNADPEVVAEGEFYALPSPFMPLEAGQGTVAVEMIGLDIKGNECMLFSGKGAFAVEPVAMTAAPVDPQACTPGDMPVGFPLQLVNAVSGQPTTIDLPITWKAAAAYPGGEAVPAEISDHGGGAYEFSLEPERAGQITASITALVETENGPVALFEDAFEFTKLIQDRSYAFELTAVDLPADGRSIAFNQFFKKISHDPFGTLLIGRRWFDWQGQQEIRVTGRFYDKDTGENIPGIERYTVSILPAAGGAPLAESAGWQSAGDGTSSLVFTALPLGDYQVSVTDTGAPEACVDVGPAGEGMRITLIAHYGEFILWILVILLVLVLLVLLILWLMCWRGGPLVLHLASDSPLMDSPTREGANVVASLTSFHALHVLESYQAALRKIEKRSGWLHAFAQVEGFVKMEAACSDKGQPIIRVKRGESVMIMAEANQACETLLELKQAAMVSVQERQGDWLKVQVTVPGYVEAAQVNQQVDRKIKRCKRRSLRVKSKAQTILRNLPSMEASYEVVQLREASWLTVMEDEIQALQKIGTSSGWLLVETAVEGYVLEGCLAEDGEETIIQVKPGEPVAVYENPNGQRSSLLGILHPARVKVLSRGKGWVKVAVAAQGYYPADLAWDQSKPKGAHRVDRPSMQASELKLEDCKPCTPDDLKLVEGIGPKVEVLLHEKGITTFRELADQVAGVREIQDRVDQEGWYFMLPDTWPEQARLLAEAKERGEVPEKSEAFLAYIAYLKGGRIPRPNDLTRIEGIGPETEKFLNGKGITTYAQLASGEYAGQLTDMLRAGGMSTRHLETWQEQAAMALAGQGGDEDAWVKLEAFKRILREKKD